MAKKHKHEGHVNHERWLVSYADFITLLFATFTALYALSRTDADKAKAVADSMRYYFGSANSQMIMMEAPDVQAIPSDKSKPPPGVSDNPAPKIRKQATKTDFEEIKQELEEYLMTKGMMNKVQVDVKERGLLISLKEAGFFESGKADVKSESYQIIQELADKLAKYRNPVRVEGHTDNVPIRSRSYPSNWELSSSRATSVARLLVDKFGVPAGRISATGYGEFRPAYPNDTPAGRARNRRVDLVVLSSDAEKSEPEAQGDAGAASETPAAPPAESSP